MGGGEGGGGIDGKEGGGLMGGPPQLTPSPLGQGMTRPRRLDGAAHSIPRPHTHTSLLHQHANNKVRIFASGWPSVARPPDCHGIARPSRRDQTTARPAPRNAPLWSRGRPPLRTARQRGPDSDLRGPAGMALRAGPWPRTWTQHPAVTPGPERSAAPSESQRPGSCPRRGALGSARTRREAAP
jgi:hypothetical protein